MERTVVRRFLYPAFLTPPSTLSFHDQFGFRPTGSTTAALVYTLHAITSLLSTNPFVIVIALDFSKAFDTVRHPTLLHKIAQLDIPENVYNWLSDFFHGHSHCTEYNGQSSALREISASIVQGSSIGPAMYVVEATDLHAVTPANLLSKYADDTYVIIPASNSHTRTLELEYIEAWSKANNLTPNRTKSVEIIFTSKKCKVTTSAPPPLPGITRCSTLKILGITVTNTLSVAEHVQDIIKLSSQTMHALRILRSHGMSATVIQHVFWAVVVAKLSYASQAWLGFTSAADLQRLNAFLHCSIRQGFCSPDLTDITVIFDAADETLFCKILSDGNHLLAPLLPNEVRTPYHL